MAMFEGGATPAPTPSGKIRPRAMMRSGTSKTWREAEDGSEILYELEWVWRPCRPATYWEPDDGGLCVVEWRLDGEEIGEADVPADVRDELLADAREQAREEYAWH